MWKTVFGTAELRMTAKLRTYRTAVLPNNGIYASAAWNTMQSQIDKLDGWQYRALRRMLGFSWHHFVSFADILPWIWQLYVFPAVRVTSAIVNTFSGFPTFQAFTKNSYFAKFISIYDPWLASYFFFIIFHYCYNCYCCHIYFYFHLSILHNTTRANYTTL